MSVNDGGRKSRRLSPRRIGHQEPRRIKRFEFVPFAILSTMKARHVIHGNLPADAQVVSSYYDCERDIFGIVVASDEFLPVASSCVIPLCDPVAIERCDDVSWPSCSRSALIQAIGQNMR